jgi:hypothetical protein
MNRILVALMILAMGSFAMSVPGKADCHEDEAKVEEGASADGEKVAKSDTAKKKKKKKCRNCDT